MNSKNRIAIDIYNRMNNLLTIGYTPENTYKIIIDSLGYDENYINIAYSSRYGESLRQRIHKQKLINGYNAWISKGAFPLTTRTVISRIKKFKIKFESTFKISPEYARSNNIDLMNFIADEELIQYLIVCKQIKAFSIKNGIIQLEFTNN